MRGSTVIRPRHTKFRPIVEGLDDRCLPSVAGLTPAQVATAYGLSGLTFGTRAANGSGQKIAIVDAYNDPNIKTELAVFDSAFNLPRPPSLTVVGQTGTSALPSNDAVWALEEALDVEWAHALAPGASIVLVEANSASVPDLMAAVNVAKRISRVSVIAMSWGASEFSGQTTDDSVFTTPGVTFVAGSGDNGSGALWPASSPNVLAVGGTTLQVNTSGTYLGETAWSGSGGGISTIEQEPSYQASVQSTGWRSTPDVAFDADPNTGVPIYSQGSWITVGGTSLGTAAWAGMIAIVDQGRALANEGTLGSTQTLSALYSLPSSAFHTVGGGYNTQTGLGSPNGAALVNDLVSSNGGTTNNGQNNGSGQPVSSPPVSSHPKGGHHPNRGLDGRSRITISGHGSSRFRPVSLDPDDRAIARPSRTRIENRPLSSNGTVT
jgi:subtilase family serine protease